MKKITLILTIAMVALLAACSGGKYDQAVVDKLMEKDEFTEMDYKELIKQANYALDDAESASDLEKWCEDNKEELTSLCTIGLTLVYLQDLGYLPESVEPEVEKLSGRFEKFVDSLPD